MSIDVRRTTCNRDCPDACGILATVEDGRVTELRGDPAHPVTRGFLCFRTSRFLDRQYGAERVTQPLGNVEVKAFSNLAVEFVRQPQSQP